MTDEHTPIIKNGIAYNSESEADLAAEIPALYLDRPFDAGYVAEAVIDSKWLAAHDAQVKAEAWDEGASSRQCHCAAWSEGECGCGNWPSERNPYRAARIEADSLELQQVPSSVDVEALRGALPNPSGMSVAEYLEQQRGR